MGEALPKQYLDLCGKPVLTWTICAFLRNSDVDRIAVVIHPQDTDHYAAAVSTIGDARLGAPVHGGETRAASVRLGLEALAPEEPDHVLIHDAARPFVSQSLISGVAAALCHSDGAFAAIPVVDALWSSQDGHAADAVPRDGLWRAQTPQGFRFEKIRSAHQSNQSALAADDVAIARAAGLDVRIVEGDEANFKVTTPEDFDRAKTMMAEIR